VYVIPLCGSHLAIPALYVVCVHESHFAAPVCVPIAAEDKEH